MKKVWYDSSIVLKGVRYMSNWKNVLNMEKITDLFDDDVSFSDGEVVKVRYDGKKGMIGVKCKNDYFTSNTYVEIWFDNIRLFQIGYDKNANKIRDIKISEVARGLDFVIESYYLRVACERISIGKVNVLDKGSSTEVYQPSESQVKMLRDLLNRGI